MSSSHLKGKSDIVGCKCKKPCVFHRVPMQKYFVLVPSTNFMILSYFTWNGAIQKKKKKKSRSNIFAPLLAGIITRKALATITASHATKQKI